MWAIDCGRNHVRPAREKDRSRNHCRDDCDHGRGALAPRRAVNGVEERLHVRIAIRWEWCEATCEDVTKSPVVAQRLAQRRAECELIRTRVDPAGRALFGR